MSPHRLLSLVAVLAVPAACGPRPASLDLLRAEASLVEAEVVGRDRAWVASQIGKTNRLNDVVLRTLPASPPSRLRFVLDVPPRARLRFSCGLSPEALDHPGVEFVVKARRGGRETVLFSALLDPLSRPAHRRWVPAEVDLGDVAGRGVELLFETRGFEKADDPRRAFWGLPAITVQGQGPPLVVVYLVDTLRADHTQVYGYGRDTTPELVEFAADGVVFEQAITHASWTKPAVASILTSLLPGRHRAVQLRDPLDTGLLTLSEMLQARGFSSGAAIANSVIYSAGTNFEQGFDHFAGLHGAEDRPSKLVEAGPVVDEALSFLDARRGLPAFLYVHTMDPHVPYAPPAPFDRKYGPTPEPGRAAADPRTDYREPADRDRLVAQYDGDIAYGDREFGRFLDELRKRGLYDQALVVFVADHGEEFLDHGQWTHGKTVFDELVRVPLVVKFPGRQHAGRRVRQQVQTGDILPTVLEAVGLPVPRPPAVIGRPLQDALGNGAGEAPVVSEISHRGYVAHGARTGREKYVQRFSPHEDELLFDLARDPKERESVLAQGGERLRRLRASVEAAMVLNPFRSHLKAVGPGAYELKLRTGGWIEGVEAAGLGAGERYVVEGNKRRLSLSLKPRPGRPREVVFSVRPQGAPVWLSGTRDGRPLSTGELFVAEEGLNPPAGAWPVRLPEVEPLGEDEKERLASNIFAAPRAEKRGLHLWLSLTGGAQVLDMDRERCEALRALGYVGSCPG